MRRGPAHGLIAVDQGFLERKVEVETLFLALAERAEVVVEFKREGRYFLKSMPFDPMHNEMMNMDGSTTAGHLFWTKARST